MAGAAGLVAWAALGQACSDNNGTPPAPAPGQTPAATPAPSASPSSSPTPGLGWGLLNEHTTCEALNPEACVGFYGFSVDRNGAYVIGPAPDGEQRTGQLTNGERTSLRNVADPLAASDPSGGSQDCSSSPTVPGVTDTVDMTLSNDIVAPVFTLNVMPGQTCTQGDSGQAHATHSILNTLMTKYYTVPFPSPTPSASPSPGP